MTRFDAVTKGQMTPLRFIQEVVDDVSEDEITRVIQDNGFLLNGKIISDPNALTDFKSGDVVTFKLDDLQFNII